MATRRETSAENSRAHHQQRTREATTQTGKLKAAFSWLLVEARRAGRLEEVIKVMLALVECVRQGKPLTDALHGQHPAAVSDTPWYARGTPSSDTDQKERVA